MEDPHLTQGSRDTTTELNASIFPPSNPFSTPRSSTPEPTSSLIQPHQASSPPQTSRTPRKGSFTEVFTPNDAPPAYSSTFSHPQSASPPVHHPEDVSPLQMPRQPSRSVSPASRVPITNHAPSQEEIRVAMGRHDRDPLMNSGRYEVPGTYPRGNYGMGSYRHARNYRARNVLTFLVLVVRSSPLRSFQLGRQLVT